MALKIKIDVPTFLQLTEPSEVQNEVLGGHKLQQATPLDKEISTYVQ